jgi:hypothetical protein
MMNIYFFQLVGVLLTLMGVIALTIVSHIFGRPLTRDEKRMRGTRGNAYQVPINLETIASAVLFLGGIGILFWSKFEPCAFLNYWLPNLSSVYRVLLACQ